jgi:NCAIR mutase (PurE)-related protein
MTIEAEQLAVLLEQVRAGELPVEDAVGRLRTVAAPAAERLDDATIDHDRARRCGFAEVIYAPGKTADQVVRIARSLLTRNGCVLISRCRDEQIEAIRSAFVGEALEVGGLCGTIILGTPPEPPDQAAVIPVVTAGTSDQRVAEEAALTCKALGQSTTRINDVGVAGVHRLIERMGELRGVRVIVCIAGMEGALPSVVGGLVDCPVIAVPTSVGYGAAFDGLAALLGMMTSCASGVTVVNIDNGFGAAYSACMINRGG